MDSKGFPFDKLIKIFFIIILTTLPLGLYYFLHTERQTDYLNQRNFRALNEIIFQYQDHFKALNNLFKFPPLDDEEERNLKEAENQLFSMKNDIDFKEDIIFKKWIQSQLDYIDDYIEYIDSQKEREQKITIKQLKENISKQRKKYKNTLTPLSQQKDSQEHIKKIYHLEKKIGALKQLQQILENKTTYQSRFSPNESSGDIEERNLKEAENQLFSMKNDIDFKEDIIFKKWIQSQLDYIDDYIEYIDSQKKDKQKITIKQLKENISKQGSQEHMKKKIDALKQLQQKIEKNIAYQSRLRLNESLGDITVTKYKAGKDPLCFNNVKFVLDDGSEPTSVTASACGFTYKTRLHSLVGNIRHNEFDAILLVTQEGKVIFSKELTALHWRDAIDSLDQTNFTGLAVTNIEHILKKATNGSVAKPINKGEEQKDSEAGKKEKPSFIGLSTTQTEGIGGKEYIFFFQPFKLNYKFYKNKQEKPEPHVTFYMIGLVEKSKFRKEAVSIPTSLSVFVFVMLLFGILSWPSVKLNFIGVREHITRGDLRFLMISLFITTGFAAIFFISLLTMEIMEKRLDNKSVNIADNINTDFGKYLDGIIEEFNRYKKDVLREGRYDENISRYISQYGKEPPYFFPTQRDIFTVNEKGVLFQGVHFFVEDFDTTLKLRIPSRNYFKKVINGNAWHAESDRIYLQRIRNYSDGAKSTQIAMPITDDDFGVPLPNSSYDDQYKWVKGREEAKPPRVLASTTYFQSLVAPILPHGLHYAIIDDATGTVLYHSQDEKAFAENFYAETEYNNELIAAIKSGKEHRKGSQNSNKGIHYPISGIYHAEQTNFHVVPLKTVPWSLITFYPKELAHSIAIESGITTFAGFLLYTLIFYLIILFFSFCNRKLKKYDDLSCVWLWPEKSKKNQYIFVSLLLVSFCLVYSLGIYYLDGLSLIGYLIVAIVAQLFLIYFSLNKKWTEIASSLKENPVLVFILFAVVTLAFILIMSDISLHDIIIILLTLVLAFSLLKYNLFLMKHQFSNNQQTNNKQQSKFGFKQVYILMVTMTLFLFSIIPSFALYKDSLSFYSQMHSRQGQLEVARMVQKRFTRLETFAKLFFPKVHAMSNSHTKCSKFNFAKEKEGIYGFNEKENELELNINNGGTVNTNGCSIVKQNEQNDDDSIMNSNYSGYLFQRLAGFHLYLSQQYTDAQDTFIENNWRFNKDSILSFTTMGINGMLEHTIKSSMLNLSTVLETLCIFNTEKESLSLPAKVAFLSMGLLFIYWFYQRISFIVKRVFAIDFPEIVKNNELEKLIQNELDLSGQCWVFINGIDKDIKAFCEDRAKIKTINDINLIPIDHSDLGKFVYYFKAEADKNENNEKKDYTFYVIPDFIIATNNEKTRLLILGYLEKKLAEARADNGIYILLCCEVHPLRCLIRPELFSGTHMQSFASISSQEEKNRWIKILTAFLEHKNYKDFVPDASKKVLLKEQDIETNERTRSEILEFLGDYNYPYYRRLWELCNRDERLMLYQLAIGRFANPNNRGVIRSLYNRGYIVRDPYFKIPDEYESFKKFIMAAEPVSTFHEWEKQAAHSLWENIKVPLFVALVFLAGLFIYISTDALETTIGLLTPLLALIPLLLRGISTVQAKETVEKAVPQDVLETDLE